MTTKEAYISFCKKEAIPLFHQPIWWDAVLNDWDVTRFEHENTFAFMPFASYKKWGFSFSRNPFLTPYSGLLFGNKDYTLEQKQNLTNQASAFLKQYSISSYNGNVQLCQGIKTPIMKSTHLLSLNIPIDEIHKNFNSNIKRQIKKASKQLKIVKTYDLKELYKCYLDSMGRQQGTETVPMDIAQRTIELCQQKEIGVIYLAVDENKNVHSAIWNVADDNSSYYLLGGSKKEFMGSGSMSLLLWHCIQLAHSDKKEFFDFEGSEIPGVAKFFASFGSTKVDYPVLSAPTNPILQVILSLRNRLT